MVVFVWWCLRGGDFVVVFAWWCFCGGVCVVVFVWCFCGGVCVVVFVWWCFCGGVCVVFFLWWCFCGVFVWCYFCGGVLVVVVFESSQHIVRVIRTKVQSIKVVTNHSIGTCSVDLYILYLFETSGTASCGTTGII